MTAVDQRPPIKKPISDYLKKSEAPWKDVANFKKSLVDNLQEQSSALLLDPHYALPISMDIFNPRKGLIVTLEDSIFEALFRHIESSTNGGNIKSTITVFSPETEIIIWNPQLLSFAGYQNSDGTIIGDPKQLEFHFH